MLLDKLLYKIGWISKQELECRKIQYEIDGLVEDCFYHPSMLDDTIFLIKELKDKQKALKQQKDKQ
jgi:hypothetical protein